MRSCSIKECPGKHKSKGFCGKHYTQEKRKDPEFRRRDALYTARWKKENPELHAAQQARKHLKYKNKINANTANWKKINKVYYNTYLAARKKRIKQSTPTWLDLSTIQTWYINRPVDMEVDHIIPTNHPDVCGLNVPWNLQYLTEIENNFKNNKFDGTYDNNSWRNKQPSA